MQQRNRVLVTGLSGAGLSNALKILEDFGYECFDNLPVAMVGEVLTEEERPQAIALDTRARGFSPEAITSLAKTFSAHTLFLTARNDVLIKRFSETRRKHPMAADRPVVDGISYEGRWLRPLQDAADTVIDTSDLSVHDLKRQLEPLFHPNPTERTLTLTLMSFGFKNGLPREADTVLDVRFLKNPHWDETLRPQTGLDKPVQKYIAEDSALAPFLVHAEALLSTVLPRYTSEGKYYFTVAIGCTGGKHRSVFVTEQLAERLRAQVPELSVRHRDIPLKPAP